MSRRLALVGRSGSDAGIEALRSLRGAVLAAVPELAEFIAQRQVAAGLVDVVATVPAPKRTLMRACRSGSITGAARIGRRWLAPQASVDAYLRTQGPRAVAAKGEDDDELEQLRRRVASGRR